MAVDVSVTANNAKRDPWAPIELSNEGPVRGAGKALLTDRQADTLGGFVLKHLPARQRNDFRLAVLARLTEGRPGDAAFRRAMALTALEFGFAHSHLESIGLQCCPVQRG